MLFPKANLKDMQSIPDEVKRNLDLRPVEQLDEVLECALEKPRKGDAPTFVLPWVKGSTASLGDSPTLNPS